MKINENPAAKFLRSGIDLCVEMPEKPCIKRFSGIEKRHRNSIKITVDLWSEWQGSNLRPDGPKLIGKTFSARL